MANDIDPRTDFDRFGTCSQTGATRFGILNKHLGDLPLATEV